MKKKVIYNEVYDTEFIFIISKSRDKVFQKYGIEWNEWGGCCDFHEKIFIIVHPDAGLDVLVHECDHAVSELWKILGIEKIKGVDECYSYMLGWLFNECKKFRKQNKK